LRRTRRSTWGFALSRNPLALLLLLAAGCAEPQVKILLEGPNGAQDITINVCPVGHPYLQCLDKSTNTVTTNPDGRKSVGIFDIPGDVKEIRLQFNQSPNPAAGIKFDCQQYDVSVEQPLDIQVVMGDLRVSFPPGRERSPCCCLRQALCIRPADFAECM
jgi:hypothetical protein